MATETYSHDAVRAIVEAEVKRWNRGRWQQAVATVEADSVSGKGKIQVTIDGNSGRMPYHLPELIDEIKEIVHALCEPPEQWKSKHRREVGREA